MAKDVVVPSPAPRLRSCVPGLDLAALGMWLADLGYGSATIQRKLAITACLTRWMAKESCAVADLDERRVEAFLDARRRHGRSCRGYRYTAVLLLGQLRSTGVIPMPAGGRDGSPSVVLLARYEEYLRRERALVPGTVALYLSFARALIRQRHHGDVTGAAWLVAGDVHDFLLCRVRHMAPKRAQSMATAVRSFLRFLFLRGQTQTDLAGAVPTVHQWRLSTVPRCLPAGDVERLLDHCDRSSATGRRNHAVLLLLARLGLRAGEVVALDLSDLRWRAGEIIVHGKGRVRDRLPLPSDVGEALALYLRQDRPACASRRVFLCRKAPHRGFAHASTVSTIVAQALGRAGLTPPTRGAHLLRHSLASTMLRRGASLAEIGQVLRHRSPNTTQIYAKLDVDALRDVALPWPTTGGQR